MFTFVECFVCVNYRTHEKRLGKKRFNEGMSHDLRSQCAISQYRAHLRVCMQPVKYRFRALNIRKSNAS